jgi:hypothetical protein
VDQLHRDGERERGFSVPAEELARREDHDAAEPLAGEQHRVPHRLVQGGGGRSEGWEAALESVIDAAAALGEISVDLGDGERAHPPQCTTQVRTRRTWKNSTIR